jgi:hypothetical protein
LYSGRHPIAGIELGAVSGVKEHAFDTAEQLFSEKPCNWLFEYASLVCTHVSSSFFNDKNPNNVSADGLPEKSYSNDENRSIIRVKPNLSP